MRSLVFSEPVVTFAVSPLDGALSMNLQCVPHLAYLPAMLLLQKSKANLAKCELDILFKMEFMNT